LQHGAPVLITGGFDTTDEVKRIADELSLPIISCTYDTFTVAAMINRAIDDRLIKKEIMMVEDILIPLDQTFYLKGTDTVDKWFKHSDDTKHSRYPVVDEQLKVQGVVTGKDIIGSKSSLTVEKVMTKHPICVSKKTSVASAAHIMIWEGIELLPVVDSQRKLLGIISRQDVLKALQYIQKQPQIGETFEDLITGQFEEGCDDRGFYLKGEISPQMTNHIGTISSGVLTTLLTDSGNKALRYHKKGDLVAENLSIYFLKPVQIESIIEIRPQVLELSRKFGKVDIEVFHEGQLVAKALMTAQLIDRT
jgi:predicted transcriptional regulator